MIDQLANSAAIALLNRTLAHEQWARDKLAPFAGRSARFDAAPFALTLQVTDDGTFAVADKGEPAVTIGVALSSLPLAMLDPQAAMKDVRLSGDAEFAQALAFVLQNLRPEPEEELSRFIGDAAAQRLVGFMRVERVPVEADSREHARQHRALRRDRESDGGRPRRPRKLQPGCQSFARRGGAD